MASVASLVSALSDHHDWIGVHVLDAVIEFLRLSLELNAPALQQRAFITVTFFGQLFNYNVTNTATLFKVLYQLISLGIYPINAPLLSDSPQDDENVSGPEQLIIRLQRIRLVTQLVDTVCEFFCAAPKSKKRMDQFLLFFLKLYYETRDGWSRFIDEIGEFPDDVIQVVIELLRTWRKNEKFPCNLNEAQEKVAEIEAIYKAKVDEILAGMRNAIEAATKDALADTDEGRRRLNRINEENENDETEEDDEEDSVDGSNDQLSDYDEEEDVENEERFHSNRKQHNKKKNSLTNVDINSSFDQSMQQSLPNETTTTCYFDGDESELKIHTQQKQLLPEDEDFMRDFDKIMNESLQSAPLMLQGPISDLVVPPQAKQKFERKLTFAMAESSNSVDKSSPLDLLPPEDVGTSYGNSQQNVQKQNVKSISSSSPQRMALMLRSSKSGGGSGLGGGSGTSGGIGAKGNVLLKAVNIKDIGVNLAEKWRKAQEEQEKNRKEMKKVTLALNERMAMEADEEHRQQQISEFEKRFIFTGGSLSNMGGGDD